MAADLGTAENRTAPELLQVRMGADLERGPHHRVVETLAEYRQADGSLVTRTGRVSFGEAGTYLTLPPNPTYTDIEIALHKNYFAKARRYRQKEWTWSKPWRCFTYSGEFRGLIDSARFLISRHEGQMAERHYENGEYLFQRDVFIPTADYDAIYLWGVHGGNGGADSIARSLGDRYSLDLRETDNEPKVALYLLAGSYFCDWLNGINPDNFMRASLGTQNYGLAAMFSFDGNAPVSGPWRVDRLALGQHLGTALQDTFKYYTQRSARTMFILGDPTLRAYVTSPPTGLTATAGGSCGTGYRTVTLAWTASAEPVDGYFVYGGANLEAALLAPFNASSINQSTYTDCFPSANTCFAVRAVRLMATGSGSLRNLSSAAVLVTP